MTKGGKKRNTLNIKPLQVTIEHGGCGECQPPCQSVCKTSCTF
ncbi:MAG TPA: six-cysteine ranthipeptide SCIFF [Candidatus Scatovivens faecipullorum]|nr:six-cysteine ranthipeptide SCIFF [Candidatus Scatovivens faecipullorum]